MKKEAFSELTDQELLVEKKKLEKSKLISAMVIGFFIGILIFGIVSWSLSSEKHFGFLIPMLIPTAIVYRMLKNSKKNKDLEDVLKKRNLN